MSINVFLYKDDQTFYPGSTIEGKVVCGINSRKNIRGIVLKLRGREHTSWTEWENHYNISTKRNERRSVHYSGDNKFLLFQINLQGGGTVEVGTYEYPFRFVLPFNIPSTFRGNHGYIRYYLKANVDIPFSFDYKDEKTFSVISPINFNMLLDTTLLNPIQYQEESNRMCCCCTVGPITMEVHLPKKAFVLGERISLRVYISNMSNDSIENLFVRVKRIIKEKCTHPSTKEKTEKKVLLENADTGVGAHGDRHYTIELQVPPFLDLPNFETSHLFSIYHTLTVRAHIKGFRSDVKVGTAITLGHIPKQGTDISVNAPVNTSYPSAPPYIPPGENFPTVHKPPSDGSYINDGSSSSYSNKEPPPPYNETMKY